MIKRIGLLACLAVGAVNAASPDPRIEQAVLPLPEDLRADATVFVYDYKNGGKRNVLRQGSNHVECQPRNDRGFTQCYPKATAKRRDYRAQLIAQGKDDEAIQQALMEAEQAGTIEPTPFGSIVYRLYEKNDRIQLLWVVLLPNAKAEDLALSLVSQRDNSLAGQGRPWMMREGTPSAHLMIPINGTPLSNRGARPTPLDDKAITDPIAQATLPLPEDLKAGATVVAYDGTTGARRVLRQGSSMIECRVRDASTGFTRCYHKDYGPEQDMRMKLAAEGKSSEDIAAAVSAARAAGTFPATRFGSARYRHYVGDDRLKLLWVLSLPNATSQQLGMPTGSQRNNSLAGKGTPWMMREGTPAAHLMIPINGTALSNPPAG